MVIAQNLFGVRTKVPKSWRVKLVEFMITSGIVRVARTTDLFIICWSHGEETLACNKSFLSNIITSLTTVPYSLQALPFSSLTYTVSFTLQFYHHHLPRRYIKHPVKREVFTPNEFLPHGH
jgi:hypothetical protein